jgi:hypothetical protein
VLPEYLPRQGYQVVDQGKITGRSPFIIVQQVIYPGMQKIGVPLVKIGGHGEAVALSPLVYPLGPEVDDVLVIVEVCEQ